jgi:hypothetical protein
MQTCTACGAKAPPTAAFCPNCQRSLRATGSSRRVLVAIAVAALVFAGLVALLVARDGGRALEAGRSHVDELAEYRVNIGKTAFNATNGVEIGRIEGVDYYEAVGQSRSIVYKVRRNGKLTNAPVSNVVVKDVPATVAEP